MAESICSIDGCENKQIARGWCGKHWARWRRHGDPNLGALPELGGNCSVPGCERKPHTKWKGDKPLCNMHWLRLYNTGSVELREKQFKSWAVCSAPGCDKDTRTARGQYCEMHYGRLRRYGQLEPLPKQRPEPTDHSNGYVLIRAQGHPVAQRCGSALEHRVVLFNAIGVGPHSCHWCETEIDWMAKGKAKLVVDHIDGNKRNNERNNLVPSCHKCNATRGLFQAWVMNHKDDPFLWQLYLEAKRAA